MRSRISSKLIFASCVGYFDRAYCDNGFYMTSSNYHYMSGQSARKYNGRLLFIPVSKRVLYYGVLRCTKLCWVRKHLTKYYYETVELPTPRPTQPKEKIGVKSGIWATFSQSKIVFRGLGLVLCREQTTRSLTQLISPQTGRFFFVVS